MSHVALSRIALSLVAASLALSANTTTDEAQLGAYEIVDTKEKFRNRSETISPNLIYDREFFERFEPVTVGDMLKRVPGVTFQGDIGEYDFVQFRGLSPAYTQVLINGKRVPGTGSDREINLDRIPAEMVDRIEIVRSPSAELDSQGMAGTINIILKDGESLKGGYFRTGVSRHTNGEDNPWTEEKYKPNFFLSYSDDLERLSYTVSGYYQERYNAKDKITNIYEDGHFDNDSWVKNEDEWDNRDSKDLSLYAKVDIDLTQADRLSLSANLFNTDREEEQYEFKHKRKAVSDPFVMSGIDHQIMDIDQQSYTVDSEYRHTFESDDEAVIGATLDGYHGELDDYEAKIKTKVRDDWKSIKNLRSISYGGELTETDDAELKGHVGYVMKRFEDHTVKFGLQAQNKTRETTYKTYDAEDGVKSPYELESMGTHDIDEQRLDFYAEDGYQITPEFHVMLGARVETTSIDQKGSEGDVSNDYTLFNPLLHVRYDLTQNDRVRLSLAQTVRRPNFDEMVPFEAEDAPADYDTLKGNPELEPETAMGVDLGYEHAFGRQFGMVGANLFYRSVKDKIEYLYLNENLVEDDGETFKGGNYTLDNVADGTVQGLELDASFPLSFIGVPSVSFFANYSYFDSEIEDPFTGKDRRFNDQPDYAYNFGLSHTLSSLGLSYGFSYQKRGDSTYEDSVTTEITQYDANLEAYIEYKPTDMLTLRLTGDNLVDADVTEKITAYESLEDKIAGKVDDYETQVERAGSVFMLTLSGKF